MWKWERPTNKFILVFDAKRVTEVRRAWFEHHERISSTIIANWYGKRSNAHKRFWLLGKKDELFQLAIYKYVRTCIIYPKR